MAGKSVVLASVLHDPDAKYVEHIEEYGGILSGMYHECYAIITETTSPRIIHALKDADWKIILQDDGVGLLKISDARRLCLKVGLEAGLHTHFVDLDRCIYWVKYFPDELENIIDEIPNYDFLVIGRTEGALKTHPDCQIITEQTANRVISLLVRREMDFLVASRGVSPRIAELILEHSEAKYCDTDGEWPIIVDLLSEAEVSYIRVDGLGYETLLKREDVVIDGETLSWKAYVDLDPNSWLHRINMAHSIAKTAITTHQRLQL